MLIFCVLFQLSIFNFQFSIDDDSVAVAQNRKLLIDKFRAGRFDSVSLLLDSIDHHCRNRPLLWPSERLLLYYWIERYHAIDSLAQHFDNACMADSLNLPPDQMVWNVLSFHSLEKKDMLIEWIDQTKCDDELFDFRVQLLETMLYADDEDQASVRREISLQVAQYSFLETEAPQEVQMVVPKQMEPYDPYIDPWRIGCSIGLGPTYISGKIAGYLSTKICLSFALNVNYRQWYYSLVVQGIFANLKKDIHADNGAIWKTGKPAIISAFGLSFGYSVNSKYLKMSPLIGIAVSECAPSEQQMENNNELRGVGIHWGIASMYGIDTDVKLYKMFPFMARNDFLTSLNVRLTYIPEMFGNVNGRYSGDMFFVALGIGLERR